MITSDALITAQASSPFLSPSSATASLVIDDVIATPCPISVSTCEVVAPFVTSTTLPFSWFLALSFIVFTSVASCQETKPRTTHAVAQNERSPSGEQAQ